MNLQRLTSTHWAGMGRRLGSTPLPRAIAVLLLVATLAGGLLAGKPVPVPPDVNVVTTIYDYDASGNILLLRSDNVGAKQASYSVSDPNVLSYVSGNPSYSTFNLDLSNQTNRTVYVTFSPVAGSSPAPLPENWYDARVISRCYDPNNNIVNLFDIKAGTTNARCSLRVVVTYKKVTYILVMAPIYPGTGYANVTCTAAAANSTDGLTPCGAWHVEPNTNSTEFPGNVPTVAGLFYLGPKGEIPVGKYYNTYRIDFHK